MSRIWALLQAAYFLFSAALFPGVHGADGQPGVPAWDTLEFRAAVDARDDFLHNATLGLWQPPRLNITYDETVTELFERIEKESLLSLPAINGLMPSFLAPFAKEVRLVCVPQEQSGLYEIVAQLVYPNGRVSVKPSGVMYDTKRQLVYGNEGKGMFNLSYDFDAENMVVYTQKDAFTRIFGFNPAYDFLGNCIGLLRFDTVRFRFPYEGRDWMIQIWKGRYVVANGGEVGLYHKPKWRPVHHYDAAKTDEMIPMSLRVTMGEKVLVDRPAEPHWWVTGFHLSDRYYPPQMLTLESSITLKDEAMLSAFRKALDKESERVSYTVKGLTVSLVW